MWSFFSYLLSYSCSNTHFHTFSIQVKDGLPGKTNPSIRRGWKATDLLGDGKPQIKNFGVAFCEKRPHFFLPVTFSFLICQMGVYYNQKWTTGNPEAEPNN